MFFSKRKGFRGFTLIELLVVVAIIGILSSIVLALLNNARAKGRVASVAQQLKEINTALYLYLDTNGNYPCFDHMWDDTTEKNQLAPYISWPKSPWGNYHWEHAISGFSISVQGVPATEAQMLDKIMDDNNGATGIILYPSNEATRLEYKGMDQTIPLVDCHT